LIGRTLNSTRRTLQIVQIACELTPRDHQTYFANSMPYFANSTQMYGPKVPDVFYFLVMLLAVLVCLAWCCLVREYARPPSSQCVDDDWQKRQNSPKKKKKILFIYLFY
jgi:hypothetical protein